MKIAVSSSDELIRLDLFLSQRLVQFSRTNIQKMISNQSIKVNGEWTKKNSITIVLCAKGYPSNL